MSDTQNIIEVTAAGSFIDDRDGKPLEYSVLFEPDTYLGNQVTFNNAFTKEISSFPAEDLDTVMDILTELRDHLHPADPRPEREPQPVAWKDLFSEAHKTEALGDRLVIEAVAAARAAGASWAVIGSVLGITRQAAHERFSRK